MLRTRISIGGLMGVVLIASLGTAALASGSEFWASSTFLATCGVLALAVVALVSREKAERAWWLGFALFGWGYMKLAFWSSDEAPKLPTITLLEAMMSCVGTPNPGMPKGGQFSEIPDSVRNFRQVGHSLWGLVLAVLGGALAHVLVGAGTGRSEAPRPDAPGPVPTPRRRSWWSRSATVVIAGLILAMTAAAFWWWAAPGFTFGATLLLTWGVIGVAALGAAFDCGRRRRRWLGATLFGAGYMILVFAQDPNQSMTPPRLAIDEFIRAVCPWVPPVEIGYPASSNEIAAANARIRKALEQPSSIHFPQETPLVDALKSIHAAARCADGRLIPMYVDPVGLQEAEKTMQSPVILDVDNGVPL